MKFENILINKKIRNLTLKTVSLFFINSLFELVGLSLIPLFLSILVDNYVLINKIPLESIKNFILSLDKQNFIYFFSMFILVFFFIKSLLKIINTYLEALVYKKIYELNSKKLYQGYIDMPFINFFDSTPSVLTRNIVQELEQYIRLYTYKLSIVREAFLLIFLLIASFYVNLIVSTFAVLIFSTLSIIFYLIFKKKIKNKGNTSLKIREDLVKNLNQDFNMVNQIKLFRLGEITTDKIENLIEKNESIKLFFNIINQLPRIFFEIMIVIGFLFVFFYLNNDQKLNFTLVPSLLFNTLIFIRLVPSFIALTKGVSRLDFFKPSKKLIENELKIFNQNKESLKSKKIISRFSKKIQLKDISLDIKNKNILKNINFTIDHNSSIAILGPSGSGKSTLLNLILGLLDPNKGKIIIDDNELKQNERWFPEVSYVPQDIYLKDDTINNNIINFSFKNKDNINNKNRLKEILKICGLDYLENKKDINLEDFKIGDRGSKISGGEKQKIALARAIYSDKNFLILDEGTSSLDEISQNQIKFILDSYKGKKTIIFVTHRESIISNFDKILKLDKGQMLSEK